MAVMEFLVPFTPGKPLAEHMAELERRVEDAADALMREAGFEPPERPDPGNGRARR